MSQRTVTGQKILLQHITFLDQLYLANNILNSFSFRRLTDESSRLLSKAYFGILGFEWQRNSTV